jgi:hypothetical protein
MLRPMIPLTIGVAVLDDFTRCTRLETDAPLLTAAAIGTAGDIETPLHYC